MSLSGFLHFLHDCSLLTIVTSAPLSDAVRTRFEDKDSMTRSSATLVFRRLVRFSTTETVRIFEPAGASGSISFTLFYLALGDVAMRVSPVRFGARRGRGLGLASAKEMDYLCSFFVLGLAKHRHWHAMPSRSIRYKPTTKSALGSRVLALSVGTALAVEKCVDRDWMYSFLRPFDSVSHPIALFISLLLRSLHTRFRPLLRSDVLRCLDQFEPELQRVFGVYSSRPTAFVDAEKEGHAGIFPDQIQQLVEDYSVEARFELAHELLADILSLIIDTQTGLLDSLYGQNPLQAQENAENGKVVWQRCWSRVVSRCVRKPTMTVGDEVENSTVGYGSGEHSVGALSYAAFLDFLCQCAMAAHPDTTGRSESTGEISRDNVADALLRFLREAKLVR